MEISFVLNVQVLATAAVELSQPTEDSGSLSVKKELKGMEKWGDGGSLTSRLLGHPQLRKPWEEIVRERVKSKTRLISKVGPWAGVRKNDG